MVAKFKKKRKRRARHNIFFSVFLATVLVLVIGFLVFTNWRINKRRVELSTRIDDLRKEIAILEQKNRELKEDISQAGTKEYLEKVAREQLGLKAPGEEVVVISKEREREEVKEEEQGFWNPSGWWQWLRNKF